MQAGMAPSLNGEARLRLEDAAAAAGVSADTLRRRIKAGELLYQQAAGTDRLTYTVLLRDVLALPPPRRGKRRPGPASLHSARSAPAPTERDITHIQQQTGALVEAGEIARMQASLQAQIALLCNEVAGLRREMARLSVQARETPRAQASFGGFGSLWEAATACFRRLRGV